MCTLKNSVKHFIVTLQFIAATLQQLDDWSRTYFFIPIELK